MGSWRATVAKAAAGHKLFVTFGCEIRLDTPQKLKQTGCEKATQPFLIQIWKPWTCELANRKRNYIR